MFIKRRILTTIILLLLTFGIWIVLLSTFLGPAIDDVPIVYPDWCCYSMSKYDYKEIKKEINYLIDGEPPNTNSLMHVLLTEGPERYNGVKHDSFAAQEETCGVCNDHTKNVYPVLKTAYEYALEGQNAIARDYLHQAEHLWKSPYP